MLEQVLGHLPLRQVTPDGIDELERGLRRRTSAIILATWSGPYDGKPGLYFVLADERHRIEATYTALWQGFMTPAKVMVLA